MPYLLAMSGADCPSWIAQATRGPSRVTLASASSLAMKALGAFRTVSGEVALGWVVVFRVGAVVGRGEEAMGGGAATAKVVMTCLTFGEGRAR